MIYTLTLNPAIDYFLAYDSQITSVQKTSRFRYLVGGKGINASKLLNELKIDNKAIILSGGLNGDKLESLLSMDKIDFIKIDIGVDTRINVKSNFSGQTFEQNSTGQQINLKNVQSKLKKIILETINKGDTLMIMGSLPVGYSFSDLEKIVSLANNKGIKLVFDLSQDHLFKLVKYHPEIIKPNIKELSDIFKVNIVSQNEAISYAKKLVNMGAKRVIVSFDKTGAIYCDNNINLKIDAIKIKEVNASGAGDSMIAGFVAGLVDNLKIEEILKLASGAGTATAASEGIASEQKIKFFAKQIKIKGEKNV